MERSIQYGAKQAVENCARVKPGEKVVIITDFKTLHISYKIRAAAELITPGNVGIFVMEKYGPRPDDGENPLEFPDELAEALRNADVSFYAAADRKGELSSFRNPMLEVVMANERLRHAHMPGITDEVMRDGMSVDYTNVQDISKRVYDIVSEAEHIAVTAPGGTDFNAEFSKDYKWIVSDGIIKPEQWSNLPDGEVYTCVKNIEGIVVVDGVLGDYFDAKYGLLDEFPVTLHIENGVVRKIECVNEQLRKELVEYSEQDENANRIGEFAVGTNIGLEKLVGNLLQDEKFPGIHVAMGHGYPKQTGANWDSEAHLDVIPRQVTINVENQIIMEDGVFVF